MNKILLIGNSGEKSNGLDGQTTKVRLYKNILIKENVPFTFVDLEFFSKHPFAVLKSIKNGVKTCDRIVLLTAQRGVKILIPYINHLNKKHKKPFVLPMIGVNILHKYIDSLNDEQHYHFMHDCNFDGIIPSKKDIRNFSKLTYILPENELIKNVLVNFFGLSNVEVLQNFRNIETVDACEKINNGFLNLVFLSRVIREKGIFEIMNSVNEINREGYKVKLFIYGKKSFNDFDENLFNKYLNNNVQYMGTIENRNVIREISKYDLFVFPSLFKSEGTPGVIAESLLAGVPILSSNFIQAEALLENNHDSLIYDATKTDEPKASLLSLINQNKIPNLAIGASKNAKKYLYEFNRIKFLELIVGN